jgi:hypothetical protein
VTSTINKETKARTIAIPLITAKVLEVLLERLQRFIKNFHLKIVFTIKE